MSENTLPEVITIDGVEYKVSELSQQTLHLLEIYQIWEKDVRDLRLALAKNEAAVRDLTREIATTVKAEKTETKTS